MEREGLTERMHAILYFLTHLFSTDYFPPRWQCGSWSAFHGWLYILSDLGIWSAYMSIPFILLYFVRKRRDLPFSRIFLLFALFIFACGTTHLVSAVMFWWPAYRLSAVVLFFTAIVSWWTIVAMLPVVPEMLSFRSPTELEMEIRKRTRSLEESENRFRTMADAAPVMIWMADVDGKRTYLNREWLTFRGRSLLEERGDGWKEGVHPEDYDYCMGIYLKAIKEGKPFEKTYRLLRHDGEYRWLFSRGTPIMGSDREYRGYIGSCIDITDQKLLTEELERQSEKYRTTVESAVDGIININIEGIIQFVNPAVEKIFGYTKHELFGKNIKMLMPSPYQEEHDEYLKNYSETGVKKIIGIGREVSGRHRDGTIFPLDLSVSEMVFGKQKMFTGIVRDLTDKKRSEQALMESEAKFRRLSDANLLGIAFWRSEGLVYEANDAFLTMFGYTRRELDSGIINLKKLSSPTSLKQMEAGFQKAMQQIPVDTYEAEFIHCSGEPVSALIGYTLLEGHPDKGVAFMLDITKEKLYQKSREMFLATLTHDLKTPIYGSEQVLTLLQQGQFDPLTSKQQAVVQELIYSNRFMERLVNNMLSTHLYEKGLADLRFEKADINYLIETNRDLYRSLAADKQQELVLNLADNLPPVMMDAFEIQRVLNNLVDNAITFTPAKGRVTISTSFDGGCVKVTVEDTGFGIDPEEQKEIFNQYRRYQKKFKHVGVGLGLYLSRLIVEHHGGTIGVESTRGQGSCFYFRLGI